MKQLIIIFSIHEPLFRINFATTENLIHSKFSYAERCFANRNSFLDY